MPPMPDPLKLIDALEDRIVELEVIIKAHRALISQHQSALKTMAQIMEVEHDVDTPL